MRYYSVQFKRTMVSPHNLCCGPHEQARGQVGHVWQAYNTLARKHEQQHTNLVWNIGKLISFDVVWKKRVQHEIHLQLISREDESY